MKPVKAHAWDEQAEGHYVEPRWISRRLFEVEQFEGCVADPCCGFGRIPEAAKAAGLTAFGFDIVDRGYPALNRVVDFFEHDFICDNFVFNPPFKLGREFALHALSMCIRKVAMIFPMRRLPAAGKWIAGTPLARVWYLTPRPSMPPGDVALEYERKGKEPSGGKQDFCVLVFDRAFAGEPTTGWLHRDRGRA